MAFALLIRLQTTTKFVELHAISAYTVGMKKMQYTIRGVSLRCNERARSVAAATHQPLNTVLLQALEKGFEVEQESVRHGDLDDLAGTWVADKEFDRAIEAMDKVDEALWK